jgi:hypothetical protein
MVSSLNASELGVREVNSLVRTAYGEIHQENLAA